MSDEPQSVNGQKPSPLTAFSWWYVLLDVLLWVAFFWAHFNERRLHAAIPMWVHMPLWAGLLGGAIGGVLGRLVPMLVCALIAGVILPVLILALFSLAFRGG